jgi:hypothetical protein
MEQEQGRPAVETKKMTIADPVTDGPIVALVKWLLNLNYLKYGVVKKF